MRTELRWLERQRGMRGIWIKHSAVRLYVRLTERYIDGVRVSTVDVASVEVVQRRRGQGLFTRLMAEIETWAASVGRAVYVESVLNERLLKHFARDSRYKQIPDLFPPSFVRCLPVEETT